MLLEFMRSNYVPSDGRSVPLNTFIERYHSYLFDRGVNPVNWNRKRIRNELEAAGFIVGQGGNGLLVCNLYDPRSATKRWERVDSANVRLRAIA